MSWYRIKAVSQLVGVSTATLRAWERRYRVPTPARTASAYRLYSDADVQTLRAMRDLVEQGLAPAEASRRVMVERPPPSGTPSEEQDPFAAARDRLVEAAVRFDPRALELEVGRIMTLGPSVTIFDRAIGPAMARIGDLWHDGTITIAQEHLASQVLHGVLSDLLRLAQPAGASRCVALACFAEEDHVIGLYGVALRFASWGFRAVMLGPRTPPIALSRAVHALSPDVVALSTTVSVPPPRASELVDAYADACRSSVWLVGGQAAAGMSAWIEARGGIVAAGTAPGLREQIGRRLTDERRLGPEI